MGGSRHDMVQSTMDESIVRDSDMRGSGINMDGEQEVAEEKRARTFSSLLFQKGFLSRLSTFSTARKIEASRKPAS